MALSARELDADEVGLPQFEPGDSEDGAAFDLSSHSRARDALEFGLSMTDPGFNIFVVGEDRSGRMTTTLGFLEEHVAALPPADDWVYLNNFRRPHEPLPFRLPPGIGCAFCERMSALVPEVRRALSRVFGDEDYQARVESAREEIGVGLGRKFDALRAEARELGIEIEQTPQGVKVTAPGSEAEVSVPGAASPESGDALREAGKRVGEKLREIGREAARQKAEFDRNVSELNRRLAEVAIAGLLDGLVAEFGEFDGLSRWLAELRTDILDNLDGFQEQTDQAARGDDETPERRYAVNLLVDRGDDIHPRVVLEANPTLENLLGRVEYRQTEGRLETHFTLIRPGALHRANGGILVLRAEALAGDPEAWESLKGAVRDREIRIAAPPRGSALPIAGAPQPKPIPLGVKVVVVGAPRWYYAFCTVDPEFQTYFKVKADIDPDMEATPENVACYAGLIRRMARVRGGAVCEADGIRRLLGAAARWASHRRKLTARFELVEDLLDEALQLCTDRGSPRVTGENVATALANRRRRNARFEDRFHKSIAEGAVMIDLAGSVVGQANALSIYDLGDHVFGIPSRVTARASVGRRGVINIERDTALGGPIQQKGVMVLQGFLAGRFARRFPLSFTCSITFEQSYGGVEGDSASLAELLAVLSDLAGLPLRQDLGVTGSVNQRGEVQAVGGVHHKVEGFYRACAEAGDLTGTQGVVIPTPNDANLLLNDEVAEAVARGRFHIWSVARVDAAVELLTGVPAGEPDADCAYPPDTMYGRVWARLEAFDRSLVERAHRE